MSGYIFISYYCQVQPCTGELSECVVFIKLLHHSQLFLSIICPVHLYEYLDIQSMPTKNAET